MLGGHCIKTWSKTKSCVTLSSAESEVLGAVKGGVEGLAMHSLSGDFSIEANICLHMDASAAIGVMQRRGVGKIRHLDVSTLWLQEKQLQQLMEVRKVHGLANAGDLMTKNVPFEVIKKHLAAINCEWRDGRAQVAAQLHRVGAREQQNHQRTRIHLPLLAGWAPSSGDNPQGSVGDHPQETGVKTCKMIGS